MGSGMDQATSLKASFLLELETATIHFLPLHPKPNKPDLSESRRMSGGTIGNDPDLSQTESLVSRSMRLRLNLIV